jgi:hypothetical protein
MANTDSILKKLYYDLNSPVAFTSKNNLYKQAKLQNKKITRKTFNFIENILVFLKILTIKLKIYRINNYYYGK